MNPLKKLAGQTAIYGLSSIVGRLMNYLLVPIYTREFVPEAYGVVTELYAFVALLIVVLLFGMETAFFRYVKSEKDQNAVYSTTFLTVLLSSLSFLIFGLSFSQPIADFLHCGDNPEYVVWFSFVIALDVISSIPLAKLREQNRPKRFAGVKLINIGVNIGLNLFFIVFCKNIYESGSGQFYELAATFYNPEVGVGYIFISNLVASALMVLLLSPQILQVRLEFHPGLWKRMIRYAFPLLILGVAGIINETLDRILLEYLLPLPLKERTAQVGIYGACYKLSIIMTLAIQAFRYAAEPFFFAEAKKEEAPKTYAEVMKYFSILLAFIFLVTMANMEIVKYFIGEKFHSGLKVVPILLMANLFLGLYYNLSVWYKITDKTHLGAFVAIGGAVITIILNIVLIPRIGYMGSAWATFFCYMAMTVASYWLGKKYYPVNYNLKKVIGYVLLSAGLYFISEYLVIYEGGMELFLNNMLVVFFLLVVMLIEKPLKKVIS